jgi:hypothetical protein
MILLTKRSRRQRKKKRPWSSLFHCHMDVFFCVLVVFGFFLSSGTMIVLPFIKQADHLDSNIYLPFWVA